MQSSIVFYTALILGFIVILLFGIGLIAKAKENLYVAILGLLLLGYMLMGKGMAYVGIAPLYVSEMTLALGLVTIAILALLRGRLYVGALNHWGAFCLVLFMLWGAARTLPFLGIYGLDALRDGVVWGYGLVAF